MSLLQEARDSISCARTLNKLGVRYRKWAFDYAAAGKLDKAQREEREARTLFRNARLWLRRGRMLADG